MHERSRGSGFGMPEPVRRGRRAPVADNHVESLAEIPLETEQIIRPEMDSDQMTPSKLRMLRVYGPLEQVWILSKSLTIPDWVAGPERAGLLERTPGQTLRLEETASSCSCSRCA